MKEKARAKRRIYRGVVEAVEAVEVFEVVVVAVVCVLPCIIPLT